MYHQSQEKVVYGIVASLYALLNSAIAAALFYAPWDLKLTAVLVVFDIVCGWLMVRYACWVWKVKSRKAGLAVLIEYLVPYLGICFIIGVLVAITKRC